MKCSRCNRQLSKDKAYVHDGKVFCDDCLMDIGLSIRECDPWATYSDVQAQKLKGVEGLSETAKKVYDLVRQKGRVTREDVMKELKLSGPELGAQLIALMHADLVKEVGQGDKMFLMRSG